jgi:hypothetical protein
MRRIGPMVCIAAVAALGVTASAQKTTPVHAGKGGSPHVKTEWTIDGANISIEYGRPSLKGRTEAAARGNPPGSPWRTGADEATVLTTDKALTFGKLELAPGTYTINTLPGDTDWQFIAGKLAKPGQWGIPYNQSLEIGRAPMTLAKTSKPVEQLTININDTPAGGTLQVEWGGNSASIPFTVAK